MESGLVTAVNRLAGCSSFSCDEGRSDLAVFVRILEGDLDEWGTTARVVNDVLDDTLDETVSLSEIQRAILGRTLSGSGASFEDAASAFSAGSDDASHYELSVRQSKLDSKMG